MFELKVCQYRRMIREIIANGDSDLIPNGTRDHARFLLHELLSVSNDEFRLLTGSLNEQVYTDDFFRLIKKKVTQENLQVKILIDDPLNIDFEKNQILRWIEEHNDQCEYRVVKQDTRDNIVSHFALADAKAFRFEPDKEKVEAIAKFHLSKSGNKDKSDDEAFVSTLESVFKKVWEESSPMEVKDCSPSEVPEPA